MFGGVPYLCEGVYLILAVRFVPLSAVILFHITARMQLLDLPAQPVSQLRLRENQEEGDDVTLRIFHSAANANARRLQNDALCKQLEVRRSVQT